MRRFWILMLLSALGAAGPAWALGTISSGGGGRGVVCRDAKNRITSAELLDLWEARTLYNRKIARSKQPVATQVQAAFTRLSGSIFILYYSLPDFSTSDPAPINLADWNRTADKFLKPSATVQRLRNVTLNDTGDSLEPATPQKCKIEQIVDFLDSPDSPKILVNEEIYKALPATDQAALIVHEALYAQLRESGETNSLRVRRAVGYIFSGASFPLVYPAIMSRAHLDCLGHPLPSTEVLIYQQSNDQVTAAAAMVTGAPAIGIFPAAAESNKILSEIFPSGFDQDFGVSYCRRVRQLELSDVEIKAGISVDLSGQGPADFQRPGWLQMSCGADDHLQFSLLGLSPNAAEGSPVRLSCRFIPAAK